MLRDCIDQAAEIAPVVANSLRCVANGYGCDALSELLTLKELHNA